MATNADVIRGLYAAFAHVGVPTVLGAMAPDIAWTEAAGFPYGGTFVDPDAVLAGVFARIGAEWDGYTAVPHAFVAEGDRVVALGDYGGTYRATGRRFDAPYAHAWTLRDGLIVRFVQYTDTALAQAAIAAA